MGMNQAPITLILIAAVGLVAVITLGIFFAVRPRATVDKTTHYYSDIRDGPQYEHKTRYESYSTTIRQPVFEKDDEKVVPDKVVIDKAVNEPTWWTPKRRPAQPLTPELPPPEENLDNLIVPPNFHQVDDAVKERQDDKVTIDTTQIKETELPPVPSFPPAPPPRRPKLTATQAGPPSGPLSPGRPFVRRPIVPIERRVDSEVSVGKPVQLRPKADAVPLLLENNEGGKDMVALHLANQAQFAHYGRVVGLAYHNKHLYVPSHRDGNISVLSTPNLKLVNEIACENCRVYDLVVLDNGDLVIAQGKRRALAKVSASDGRIVQRQDMEFASKGIALSPSKDQIYVLTRSHDKIYKYDTDLKPNGSLVLPNTRKDDCNFITVNMDGHLYVSCENQVFVLAANGELLDTLAPDRGSYSVGIDVDSANRVFVVRRGKAHVDVYVDNKLVQSLGDDSDVLWSDLAVGDGHLYVIDYIAVTVQAYKYLPYV